MVFCFRHGKDLIGKPWWSLEFRSGYQLIAKCRYCLHSDCNCLNTILGASDKGLRGLTTILAAPTLLGALFVCLKAERSGGDGSRI